MKRSSERILTTHTGSLPRPEELTKALTLRDHGELSGSDAEALSGQVREAVAGIVREQADAGIDVVNDGEMSKIGYATYVRERLTGFEGEDQLPAVSDLAEFPEYAGRVMGGIDFRMPACTGPVAFEGEEAVREDVDNLQAATGDAAVEEVFVSAASPGVISLFLHNHHFESHEAYLYALADAMKEEYDAIHAAGFLVQLDCPDLAMGRHIQFADASLEQFRKNAELHVEALNYALRDIPPDRLRMHLCWGNYEGPHHHDVPLEEILDIVLSARPQGISLEAANPRHEHEWKVFEDVQLPDEKVLIPGVIDSTNNYIEHPELVAQRIVRFANVVGRENVIASTDCGFATFASFLTVDPLITWLKFRAMAEGARLATEQLWR